MFIKTHHYLYYGIFHRILTIPHNTIMNLNNVMTQSGAFNIHLILANSVVVPYFFNINRPIFIDRVFVIPRIFL